ncbi:hypothetical protein L0P51_22945, partial [Acetatifactor sp. DFI.5.50]|nr:hypothetical protein [Acetatifactor sp. DFI.5.50]
RKLSGWAQLQFRLYQEATTLYPTVISATDFDKDDLDASFRMFRRDVTSSGAGAPEAARSANNV